MYIGGLQMLCDDDDDDDNNNLVHWKGCLVQWLMWGGLSPLLRFEPLAVNEKVLFYA